MLQWTDSCSCAGASVVLGLEVAGDIEEVAEGVSNFKKGDKVMALLDGGG